MRHIFPSHRIVIGAPFVRFTFEITFSFFSFFCGFPFDKSILPLTPDPCWCDKEPSCLMPVNQVQQASNLIRAETSAIKATLLQTRHLSPIVCTTRFLFAPFRFHSGDFLRRESFCRVQCFRPILTAIFAKQLANLVICELLKALFPLTDASPVSN